MKRYDPKVVTTFAPMDEAVDGHYLRVDDALIGVHRICEMACGCCVMLHDRERDACSVENCDFMKVFFGTPQP